jgi:regulator of sirC expression with transglutaminase-like and TPR domain
LKVPNDSAIYHYRGLAYYRLRNPKAINDLKKFLKYWESGQITISPRKEKDIKKKIKEFEEKFND